MPSPKPKFYACTVSVLVQLLQREEYSKGAFIWNQASDSDSAKVLICGKLVSRLEGNETQELIAQGHFIGELGLVHGMKRLTTVECVSESAILYSLNKNEWEWLAQRQPRVARIIDMLVIRYLAHRVQHVSNRIFETRCLPI
jgi:sulfate permease, SulP family